MALTMTNNKFMDIFDEVFGGFEKTFRYKGDGLFNKTNIVELRNGQKVIKIRADEFEPGDFQVSASKKRICVKGENKEGDTVTFDHIFDTEIKVDSVDYNGRDLRITITDDIDLAYNYEVQDARVYKDEELDDDK